MIRYSKNKFLFCIFVFFISYAQADVPRSSRSEVVDSDIAVIDDNVDNSNQYNNFAFTRFIGGRNTLLQNERVAVLTRNRMNEVKNPLISGSSDFDSYMLSGIENKHSIVNAPVKLEGTYLLILAPYKVNDDTLVVTTPGILNTTLNSDDQIHFRLGDVNVLLTNIITGMEWVKDRKEIERYRVVTNVQNIEGVSASAYRNAWIRYLSRNAFRYDQLIFVQDKEGRQYPALIVRYGGRVRTLYAMYGVFQSQAQAEANGFRLTDTLYFSEAAMTPIEGDTSSLFSLDGGSRGLERSMRRLRFGARGVWTQHQVRANFEHIEPLLAWRSRQYSSSMDDAGQRRSRSDSLQFIEDNLAFFSSGNTSQSAVQNNIRRLRNNRENLSDVFSYFRPMSPVDWQSKNTSVTKGMFDADWYYSLFSDQFNAYLADDGMGLPRYAENFMDYEAFVLDNMKSMYDPTVYQRDTLTGHYAITRFNLDVYPGAEGDDNRGDIPSGNAIYSREGVLLSRESHFQNVALAQYFILGAKFGVSPMGGRTNNSRSRCFDRAFEWFIPNPLDWMNPVGSRLRRYQDCMYDLTDCNTRITDQLNFFGFDIVKNAITGNFSELAAVTCFPQDNYRSPTVGDFNRETGRVTGKVGEVYSKVEHLANKWGPYKGGNGAVDLQRLKQDFEITFNPGYDETWLDSVWHFGNPQNYYQPYKSPNEFFVYNGHYVSSDKFLRLVAHSGTWITGFSIPYPFSSNFTYDFRFGLKYYVRFKWPIVFHDQFGFRYVIGEAHYVSESIFNNTAKASDGLSAFYSYDSYISCKEGRYSNSGCIVGESSPGTREFIIDKNDHKNAQGNTSERYNNYYLTIKAYPDLLRQSPLMHYSEGYDLTGKDYFTDQHDVADRSGGDPKFDTDKKKALKDIAWHIGTAEGINIAMKIIYDQINNPHEAVAWAAGLIYELKKRIENLEAVKMSVKMAIVMYKVHKEIQETLDLIYEMKQAYAQIGVAWDGLKSASSNIYEYYSEFDWSAVRMTNISSILPTGYLHQIDHAIGRMQYSLVNFNETCHRMAIKTDMIVISPTVKGTKWMLRGLAYSTTTEATAEITQAQKTLDDAQRQLPRSRNNRNATRSQYISLVTGGIMSGLTGTQLRVTSDGVLALKSALNFIEAESRDWQRFYDYTTKTFSDSNLMAFQEAMSDQDNFSLYPVFYAFGRPPSVFNRELERGPHTYAVNSDFMSSRAAWNFTNLDDRIMAAHRRRREQER